MAEVPQKTLNWLYDVLKREYRDPTRTYSDVAQALSQQPGLAPCTEVYTSEDGTPALLLNLEGTLPVNFRGTIYLFPIVIWIPHAYPYEAPTLYVNPADDMVVRPGQHVSASDGRIYHRYLARWSETWDRSSILEFLNVLADVFSKEPPVMAKLQQAVPLPPRQQRWSQSPPAQKRYDGQPLSITQANRNSPPYQGGPPPPPPKQRADGSRSKSAGASNFAANPGRYDAPPPLQQQDLAGRPQPPLPQSLGMSRLPQLGRNKQYLPQRTTNLRQEEQPPVPQPYQAQISGRPPPMQLSRYNAPTVPNSDPITESSQPYVAQHVGLIAQLPPPQRTQQALQMPQVYPQAGPVQTDQHQQSQAKQASPRPQPQFQPQARPQPCDGSPPNQQAQSQNPRQLPPPTQKDLLSEEDPFRISLVVSPKFTVPSPPIPTNPEKTAFSSHLSERLLQHLHATIDQAQTSAIPSLQTQHTALQSTSTALTAELETLRSLSSQLQSNISALQTTLAKANDTIKSTQDKKHSNHPDNIPSIDQIIIPPTVVARQMYDAVAEQRGYETTIDALNDAFVRGRIGTEVWGRKVRECAREEMRRKWLVRKIGEGLGLEGL